MTAQHHLPDRSRSPKRLITITEIRTIALYRRLLPIAAESGTRNAQYAHAFEIVRAISRLRAEGGEQTEFALELDEIRSSYRAKRNFIKLLDTLF